MSVGAVHLDFFHEDGFGFEAISGANELQAVADLVAAAVLLVAELVAGKREDDEASPEALSQVVHLRIIPGRRPSEGSHVFHQNDFPFELREVESVETSVRVLQRVGG